MEYDNGDFVPAGSVSAGDVLIDGNAIGDVGNVVLRDRKVLSEDGIFIVAITVNRREKRIISKAKVHTRGFVYVKKSRDILREVQKLSTKVWKNTWLRTASIGVSSRVLFVIVWLSTSLTRPNVDQLSYQLSWKYAKINIRGKVDRRLFLIKEERNGEER